MRACVRACVKITAAATEKLTGNAHILGGASFGDHVDCTLIDPYTLSVELYHYIKGFFRCNLVLGRGERGGGGGGDGDGGG